MGALDQELAQELAAWEARGLTRHEQALEGLVDLVTNDYLSLAQDTRLIEAARLAAQQYGAGGRSARLLAGGSELDHEVERAAAEWLGAEAGLLFPSGYQANTGLVPALVGPGDLVVSDALNHASLIDGARLSRARVEVHDHLDADHLERVLQQGSNARRRLVLVEGVYSMDGDAPDLALWSRICARHGASLIVDEAHSLGLLGPAGAGAWAASDGDPSVLAARLVTGGKALGAMGAVVVGSAVLREQLVHRARGFMFSTAVAPAVAGALLAGIEQARAADRGRDRALGLARDLAGALGLPTPAAAIVPIPVGSLESAIQASKELRAKGLDVRAIRPPTVAPGAECLRVVCHSHNEPSDLQALVTTLKELNLPAAGAARPSLPSASPLVVLGTDTDVGKTIVSAALLRAASKEGPAHYWKPVQSGPDCDTQTVKSLSAGEVLEPGCTFDLPASPHEAARAEGREVDLAELDRMLGEHLTRPGTLVIEPAGGVQVPLTDECLQIDWLARHRMPCVLVARSGLGTLNHTLLTLESLERRNLRPRALILVGPPHPSNHDTLARMSRLPVLELPLLDPLGREAIDGWLEEQDLGSVLSATMVSAR
ncbi:MAG: dethiobiotin synthase [Planctomycetes bacterium]|nr:dethiobiotin synthase [Planctomycetota bacterium]